MDVMNKIVSRAKANIQRIVLPEATEIRTLTAANKLIADGVAHIILIGNKAEVLALAAANHLSHIAQATLIDPVESDKRTTYATLLHTLRKDKGMTLEQADTFTLDPLFFACLMIKNGDADGEVAGAKNTTGNVLRPALQIIRTAPGINVVSGAFLMFCPDKSYGEEGLLIFADCAVMPNPTATELAQIAVSTGHTARAIAGIEPRIAMLSFSTKGSAQHDMVAKIQEATRLAQALDTTLNIDGELQSDAALVPEIAASKAQGSTVAGRANVLVFPSLESGNIAYKLVQRLAQAEAVGPILQGMAAPVNDLSRGCSVDDIYKLVAITANQAIGMKQTK